MESQIVAVKDQPGDAGERKEKLIRQGEFHRVGVLHAKAQIKQAARPEALFHSAIDHAGWALRSRIDRLLHPTGTSVGALMPYALTVFRFIRHRRIGKASLGVAAVLAGVGFYIQQRRARQVVVE